MCLFYKIKKFIKEFKKKMKGEALSLVSTITNILKYFLPVLQNNMCVYIWGGGGGGEGGGRREGERRRKVILYFAFSHRAFYQEQYYIRSSLSILRGLVPGPPIDNKNLWILKSLIQNIESMYILLYNLNL